MVDNNNTSLWDSVFKTNPNHTKGFKKAGGFSGTAIKPLYLIHKATETWGPMGDAWGAETAEHVISGNTVFIKARLWYPGKNGKAWVEHWGGDVLVKGEKNIPNDEAFKMAFTDAVGKCLVQLGFSADVHFGLFDDSKYVADLKKEVKAESSAAYHRKLDAFKAGLVNSENPLKFWNDSQDFINEALSNEEPEAVKRALLNVASLAIEKLILAASDPGVVWHEQQALIQQIAGEGVKADYTRLVDAGKKRREEIAQEEAMRAGMPDGFNGIGAH